MFAFCEALAYLLVVVYMRPSDEFRGEMSL